MRRIWATFLLGIFSLMLMLPAVYSTPNLPACCRRNGKHHCSMEAVSHSGPSAQSARCAAYPGAQSGAVFLAILTRPAAAGSSQITQPIAAARSQFAHDSYNRAGQQRGPPTPLC
jgi:hypothetical protein